MTAERRERGATMAVFAPILAALIGGAAAIGAAVQIVNLGAETSDTPSQSELTGSPVEYGDR